MRSMLRAVGSVLVLELFGMTLWAMPTGAAPFAYVTDIGSNTVSVIDTATNTVVATVPVESAPVGVGITPDGTHTYVANSGSNTVSVIDTATNTVVATVPVGGSPRDVGITPDGTHAYVANNFSNTVSVIDTATNTVVATVPVAPGSAPFRVAITPSSSCLGTGVDRLRGQVRTAEDPPGIPDVTVTLTGPGGCQDSTTTNATGHYVFRTLGSGTYTVTPVKDGCTFTPPSRTVTLAAAAPRAHFRGTCAEDEEGERERKEHRDRD